MPSLRERKKLQAKAKIQSSAIRLFMAQGYDETTTKQIADLAEVSPSTLFRYFKTKEAIIMYDSLDPVIMESFRQQPTDMSIIAALRGAIGNVFGSLTPKELKVEMQRAKLIRSTPELRAHLLDEMARSIDLFADLIGERVHIDAGDIRVRNMAGAIIGVGMAALLVAHKREPDDDSLGAFDSALASLERGLELK